MIINSTNTRINIIKKLAKKYNMPYDVVEKIVTYQYKFAVEQMQSGEFKPIMLMHLGKFYPSKKRKEYWEQKLKQQTNESRTESTQ